MVNLEAKKITWLELFSDLLFVAAIATVTGVLFHVENGEIPVQYIFKFILIFVPIWWSWVGQTLFTNRFGKDLIHHRIFLILEMIFAIIMIASLTTDFDAAFLPFLVGYLGLRALTAIQYLVVSRTETGARKKVALYLGKCFWIGIAISLCSVFFDSWWRYFFLYLGIVVDIIVPMFGRKFLVKSPVNGEHLIERFSQFTTILFGEMLVSTIIIIQPNPDNVGNIMYGALFFILIISMGWQYFDNIDLKIDKTKQSAGQRIIYGHLFILMAISMITISVRLLYAEHMNSTFILVFIFIAMLMYLLSTFFVFSSYRHATAKLKRHHIFALLLFLCCFIIMIFMNGLAVSNFFILIMMVIFYVIYAFISLK